MTHPDTVIKKTLLAVPSFGLLQLVAENDHMTEVRFTEGKSFVPKPPKSGVLAEAVKQFLAYFRGELVGFSLPLMPKGTVFQQKVWSALQNISYGKTATYGDIAAIVGCPKGARAVGLANNRNPIAIIIPCHRVIGSDGSLTGYAGGLDRKATLLDLENNGFRA